MLLGEKTNNVFEFADTTVREIMTPRQDIKGVDITTPPDQVLARTAEVGHSRMPVYRAQRIRRTGPH